MVEKDVFMDMHVQRRKEGIWVEVHKKKNGKTILFKVMFQVPW
jgi:hypothetical protein